MQSVKVQPLLYQKVRIKWLALKNLFLARNVTEQKDRKEMLGFLWLLKTLIIKRFGTQRKCQVIGVRRGVASWKCTYKGWHSVYDEYVPIENIKVKELKETS